MQAQKPTLALRIKSYFRTLNPLKIVVFLCLVFAAFITIPDQTLELYRYTAQALAESYASGNSNYPHFHDPQGLIGFIILVSSVLLLSIAFLALAAFLYSLHRRENPNETESHFSPGVFATIACLPSLAVGIGLLLAVFDVDAPKLKDVMMTGARLSFAKDFSSPDRIEQLSRDYVASQLEVNWWLYFGAAVLLLLAAALFVASCLFFRAPVGSSKSAGERNSRWLIVAFALPIILSIAFVLSPGWLARTLSSFAVICLFFAVAALFLAALSLLESRVKMPLLFLLVVCAVVFSVFGLNDNHSIRSIASRVTNQPAAPPAQTTAEGFTRWLKARKDLGRYDAYPVYVIAAEGGGIYAAFRAATFLTSLQDLCPRFSQHLFAISSVSGGSIGAAVFSSLVQKIREGDERFRAGSGCRERGNDTGLFLTDVAEEILQDDFLSPVLAAFLFPDFLQRFLFFPIPPFDRSIALEKSLEGSWDRNVQYYYARFQDKWIDNGNPLRDPFTASWSPQSDAPALFINTTEVETGLGRVISPFSFESEELTSFPLPSLQSASDSGPKGIDISMSTAAVLSARFPWITPPGSFRAAGSKTEQSATPERSLLHKVNLVDGGYLDNSGAATALAIVREIEVAVSQMSPSPKVEINLIVLTSGDFANPNVVLGDYLAPFQALLSTRAARGEIAVRQAERVFARKSSTESRFNSLGKVELSGYGYPLPLGWRLSPITRLLILGQNGDPARCRQDKKNTADCLSADIVKELNR